MARIWSRPARVVLVVATVLALAACGTDDDTPAGPAGSSAPGTLAWEPCDGGLECATLPVPLDHDDPDGPTIDLALARRSAGDGAVGSVVVNPGGPGASGIEFLQLAPNAVSRDVAERYHVVSWDPRGVGQSAPIDCVDDLDDFFAVDRSPIDEAGVAAIVAVTEDLVDGCAERSGDLLPHVGTDATVRDLDRIRDALGQDDLTYVGFSYGSTLGLGYADEFGDRARAVVLDGAIDPTLGYEEAARGQATGFEASLAAFLDDCATTGRCGFARGRDPDAAYDELVDRLRREPAATRDGRAVGPGLADIGVVAALYAGTDAWPLLDRALADAADGDGTLLATISDAYTGRNPDGSYGNLHEAFYAIGCTDGGAPASFGEVAALADELAAVAPRFGATTAWLGLPCALWPERDPEPPAPVRAPDAPPVLVLGTTGDPATPLAWAEALADQLAAGHLVVLDDEGHTAYGRGDPCIDGIVDAYLLDLVVPEPDTRCPA